MAEHEIKTKLSGVTFPDPQTGMNRQEIIAQYLRKGSSLELRVESNEHAENGIAIAVWLSRGCVRKQRFHIGYLNESRKMEIQAALARGVRYTATVLQVTGGTEEHPTYGVNIVIRWRD